MFIGVGKRRAFLTHGHIYNEAFHPNLNEGDILIHGHFHIPWLFDVDGVTIASPGSIAIPKNDSPNSYMIIDNDKIDIKNLDGESILNSIRRDYNQKY
jgi:predicted phosphodiesterase